MSYEITRRDALEEHAIELSDEEFESLIAAVEDSRHYRLGDEAADENDIEDDGDREGYLFASRMADKLEALRDA